jgi:hypothetical protein
MYNRSMKRFLLIVCTLLLLAGCAQGGATPSVTLTAVPTRVVPGKYASHGVPLGE